MYFKNQCTLAICIYITFVHAYAHHINISTPHLNVFNLNVFIQSSTPLLNVLPDTGPAMLF